MSQRGCKKNTTRLNSIWPQLPRFLTHENALGLRVIYHAFEWKSKRYNYPNQNFISFLKNCKEQQLLVHQNYDNFDIGFTDEQQKIIHLWTEELYFLEKTVMNYPKRAFMNGEAGAGKSTVIKEIRKKFIGKLGSETATVLTPTGTVAINVECKAIHSGLKEQMFFK